MPLISYQKYDAIVYSSHKTATMSILETLKRSGYSATHIHTYENNNWGSDDMLRFLKWHAETHGRLNLVSVLRDPLDRLRSSFFQLYHTDEMNYFGTPEYDTTIMKTDIETLYNMFDKSIQTVENIDAFGRDYGAYVFKAYRESLTEIGHMIGVNIFDTMVRTEHGYFYSHDLFNLYVFDFEQVIRNMFLIESALQLQLLIKCSSNLSSDKASYEKYTQFEQIQIADDRNSNIQCYFADVIRAIDRLRS